MEKKGTKSQLLSLVCNFFRTHFFRENFLVLPFFTHPPIFFQVPNLVRSTNITHFVCRLQVINLSSEMLNYSKLIAPKIPDKFPSDSMEIDVTNVKRCRFPESELSEGLLSRINYKLVDNLVPRKLILY